MPFYTRKQYIVEARQLTAENFSEVYAWVDAAGKAANLDGQQFNVVRGNASAGQLATLGDYVIKDSEFPENITWYVLPEPMFIARFELTI